MYQLTSSKGNYYVEMERPDPAPSVEVLVKDGVEEIMVSDATSDKKRIKRSLEKWEFIVNLLAFRIKIWQDGGRKTCALCMKYDPIMHDCEGCPIYIRTGRRGCQGTPYEDFIEASSSAIPDRLACARREVDFLQSLLPIPGIDLESPF